MNIHDTPWARRFKKECPTQYKEAIEYASNPDSIYDIIYTDEMGAWEYAIVCYDSAHGFWMDTFPTKEEAEALMDEMNWKFEE